MEAEFESFPARYDEEEESTTIGKLKRFLFSTTASVISSAPSAPADSATRPQSPASLTRTASTASAPIPFPKRAQQDSPTAVIPAPPLLNRRPTRLSNVTPSVRLAAITSDGEFNIQSSSQKSVARSIHSHAGADYGFFDGISMGRSPTANNDSFQNLAALSSIPGFPLQDADTRSVRSMSSSAIGSGASPSVAHIFRRLRGEGLSKEYWVNDETTSHCFDCESLFSIFRRKHHCRICGQVFCGRCASNLISSVRFGSQGVLRVCNLCLSIMDRNDSPAHNNDSTPNSARFRPGLREHGALSISAPIQASARPPQSQFAASHLFPRSETPNFYPSSEMGGGENFSRISEGGSSRAETPQHDFLDEEEEEEDRKPLGSPLAFTESRREESVAMSKAGSTAIAPFRRVLGEEEGAAIENVVAEGNGLGISTGDGMESRDSADAAREAHRIEAPRPSPNLAVEPTLILPLILASPSLQTSPLLGSALSTRTSPVLTSTGATKRRSDSLSQLLPDLSKSPFAHPVDGSGFGVLHDGPGPDPRDLHRILASSGPYQEASKGQVELSPESMEHVRKMLRQSLVREGIPHPRSWELELMRLLKQVARDPAPNVRGGDSIDIRKYVRVKKIPGGAPKDSEYVEGVVCTKNVLHKQMPRNLVNPRIMLFSFPLEYQRVETQLMSLEPLLKQEREYLRNLVARIVAQRPHLILVERNVSRLALEYLMEANVAVARNVKPEVIQAISRATQADVITSMDKLALEPRLGRCATFRVQTFVHSMIPGRRKTFMRFEGCSKELGGTLLLRGGTMEVLKKVKSILETMVMVVYNVKLEGYLLRDELVLPVVVINPTRRPSIAPAVVTDKEKMEDDGNVTTTLHTIAAQEQERTSQQIAQALRPYQSTALSTSPYVRFPAPYPLASMCEVDNTMIALRALREYEETEQILRDEEVSRTEALEASVVSMAADSISETFSLASLDDLTPENLLTSFAAERIPLSTTEEAVKILQTPEELARISRFVEAEQHHSDQLRLWDSYLAQTKDSFDPRDHTSLYVLEALACTQTDRLCIPPAVRAIPFYGPTDVSLGQYIESTCRDAGRACSEKACERPLLVHYKSWVHGGFRVMVIPEAHVVDLQSPELEGHIVMWSWCKLCKLGSPQTAMSEETYRISFAKYLELSFYPQDFVRRDANCQHNSHTDHVRFWMFNRITFQITVDPIELRNIVSPPLLLKIKPEKQLQLRNEEYLTVLRKTTAFWNSIDHRIASFNYDLVQPERLEAARTAMEELSTKSDVDRRMILRLLSKTYEQASTTNGTEMTSVRRTLQNKAVEWEADWTSFEQKIFPADKDVRRVTAVQLKRLFSDGAAVISPERRSISASVASSTGASEQSSGSMSDDSSSHSTLLPLSSARLAQLDAESNASPRSSSSSITAGDTTILATTSSLGVEGSSPPTIQVSPISRRHSGGADDDSDSTVCGDAGASTCPSPFLDFLAPAETSEAELEYGTPSARRHHHHPTGTGVAQLVNFFSDSGQDSPVPGSSPRVSPKMPVFRRGVSDKPRSVKRATEQDVFSDGGYAAQVGVAHLANRAFADKPSRIPWRTTRSLTKAFEGHVENGPPSASTSRAESRTGSGRNTPAISTHRIAAGGSNVTVRQSTASSRSTLKGKGTGVADSEVESDRGRGRGKAGKSKNAKDLGVVRSTTSTANKSVGGSRRPATGSNFNSTSRVATIARQFNQKARDADKQRRINVFRGRSARPVAVAQPTILVFDNVRDAAFESDSEDIQSSDDGADDEFDDDNDHDAYPDPRAERRAAITSRKASEDFIYDSQEPTSLVSDPSHHQSDSSSAGAPPVTHVRTDTIEIIPPRIAEGSDLSVPPSPALTSDSFSFSRMLSEGESSGNERGSERGSIIKAISNLWSYRGGDFTPLEYPLHASEHIFENNPILVREDEPSSILAFTLSSKAYREKLKESDTAPKVTERSEAFMPDEVHPRDGSSTWGVLDYQPDGVDIEDQIRSKPAKHFRLQFEEGTTSFFCKIFFAEQFDALRRNCGCDSQFIESLARCVKWESSGGRSKVDFLKTRDDRFILKEISRLEMDALLRFAPAYFEYMSKAFHGLPTILAKIYGFYRIGLRNPATGKVMRLDILVMENLFYDRELTQVFDLKGSTRNRHVQPSNRPHEVLMDENLVEISYKNPLYVREASKRFIKNAVFNDSLFLSTHNIMDFSMVVGVDSVKQELVVGIVDFIRTYTWDKRMESWVKDSNFLGGGSSKLGGPTIVTPKQYSARFRKAIDGYFLLVPTPWLQNPTTLAGQDS